MERYRAIEFGLGHIDKAIKQLEEHRSRGELVFGVFNGAKLYSDIDDVDSCYKKVTGMTKSEHEEYQRKWHEEYLESERKHKEEIPELTVKWVEKGMEILDEKYHELWEKIVPIRLGDMYKGMELGASLDIISELNSDCSLLRAKEIIDGQGHSGMSYGLVRSMVKKLCESGHDFSDYITH